MSTTPQQITISPDAVAERHEAALEELVEGEVRFGAHDRMLYATDASIYQVEPLGVVIPASLDDVRRVVRYCSKHDLPILPRGGGTSLAGQAVNRAIVIDFSAHCRKLLELDEVARRCTVEPGMVLDELNAEVRTRTGDRLWFAPDVATSNRANIGGMIGNNSAGSHSVVYGRTVEHVHGLDVMLADATSLSLHAGAGEEDQRVRLLTQQVADVVVPLAGLVRERFPRITRHNDGYNFDLFLDDVESSTPGTLDRVNLARLVCGSEGTLCVTTRATLNLVEYPPLRGLAVIGFESVDAAMETLVPILRTKPSAVELLDDAVITMAVRNVEYRRYVELLPQPGGRTPEAVFYVEYFAHEPAELETKLAALSSITGDAPSQSYTTQREMDRAWKLRKAGEPLLHAVSGTRKPLTFVEDTAVDPARLAAYVREFRKIISRHGTTAAFWAHASVGLLHIRPLVDPRDPVDLEMMQTMAEEVADLVRSFGGALSGEHGNGRVRSALLERFYGRELVEGFRKVKAIFDPRNRMNPGVIVDPHPMTERLRVNPTGRFVNYEEVETHFDYHEEEGLDHAVELCNGSGVCRKKAGLGGTMCPSYMATLDERHSTRGRANALRLAISGQIGHDFERFPNAHGRPAWNDPETLRTLDLCLSCKACKTECPTNVDMARYKAEYLAQSYFVAGEKPRDARAFARVRSVNRLGSGLAPVSNWVANFPPVRRLVDRRYAIAPQRSLPVFRRSLFRQMRGQTSEGLDALAPDAPCVVLFTDCFTTYNEPEIALATIRTLNAFGYRVHFPDVGCCARPAISLGLLDEARTTIEATFIRLFDAAKWHDAQAVLFLEPSCLSAVTDDWRYLKMGLSTSDRRWLADNSFLAEDFLERHWDEHPRHPAIKPPRGRLVLHAHCHQKALWGAETSAGILQRLFPGGAALRTGAPSLTILDSGCCGMAGAFGMGARRYEISMRIGDLSLFPAARALRPGDTLVAPGTSCRHQLRDALDMRALHPMQVIHDAL